MTITFVSHQTPSVPSVVAGTTTDTYDKTHLDWGFANKLVAAASQTVAIAPAFIDAATKELTVRVELKILGLSVRSLFLTLSLSSALLKRLFLSFSLHSFSPPPPPSHFSLLSLSALSIPHPLSCFPLRAYSSSLPVVAALYHRIRNFHSSELLTSPFRRTHSPLPPTSPLILK